MNEMTPELGGGKLRKILKAASKEAKLPMGAVSGTLTLPLSLKSVSPM